MAVIRESHRDYVRGLTEEEARLFVVWGGVASSGAVWDLLGELFDGRRDMMGCKGKGKGKKRGR